MRVVSVNNCSNGSTGMIMSGVHQELLAQGHESWMCWARGRGPLDERELVFGSKLDVYAHGLGARAFDAVGRFSRGSTAELVRRIDAVCPELIHLHNIHGYCLNMDVLFDYLANFKGAVVWTLHSCWPFTGHCSYFTYAKCEQWKSHCSHCPQTREFPKSWFVDNSKRNYDWKKDLFTAVPGMMLVTPSQWLAGLVGESFLGGYDTRVIRNGVDTGMFRPCGGETARRRYGLEGKRVLLGVASPWSRRKGLDDMKALFQMLGDEYAVVVVGLSRDQISTLPAGMLGLERTESAGELAELYSAADLFVNPTREDNYPTVNIEALACGTPVLTYDTGGSPECSDDPAECIVATEKTPESLREAVEAYFDRDGVSIRPDVKSKQDCSREYLALFEELLGR